MPQQPGSVHLQNLAGTEQAFFEDRLRLLLLHLACCLAPPPPPARSQERHSAKFRAQVAIHRRKWGSRCAFSTTRLMHPSNIALDVIPTRRTCQKVYQTFRETCSGLNAHPAASSPLPPLQRLQVPYPSACLVNCDGGAFLEQGAVSTSYQAIAPAILREFAGRWLRSQLAPLRSPPRSTGRTV